MLLRILTLSLFAFASLCAAQKALLFNDTSTWYHWGCTGTSTALKEHIQNLGFELDTVPITTTYSLQQVPSFEEFESREKFECFEKANEKILQQMQSTDAIVITGEGTIHDLRPGPRALLYLAYVSKKFLNKHIEIINHSAYPKDDPLFSTNSAKNEEMEKQRLQAQRIYKTVYEDLDFVAIRETCSQESMRQIGVASVLSFDCLPLYIRDHYHTPKKVEKKTAVIAGSVAFTEAGADHLCRYLEQLNQMGYEIKVLTGAAAFPSRDDEAFVQFLKAHTQVPLNFVVASSMEEWLDTINHATFLVSGRFHHSIAAFCLNTPFIALNSNTHKVHAICSLLGKQPPLLFSDPHLLDHLLERTKAIESTPLENNKAKMREICQLAERNFDGLKKLLTEPAN